jgi:hypothetical protein
MPEWATSYILTIVTSVGASGLLTAGLIYLTKAWITERVKNSIKHEYDVKLESHKAVLKAEQEAALERMRADNAQLAAMLNTASSASSAAQAAAHQERLASIRALWDKIVWFRRMGIRLPTCRTFTGKPGLSHS